VRSFVKGFEGSRISGFERTLLKLRHGQNTIENLTDPLRDLSMTSSMGRAWLAEVYLNKRVLL
jgi:hypothetical protein